MPGLGGARFSRRAAPKVSVLLHRIPGALPAYIPRNAWRTVFALVITAHGCLAQGRVNEFLGVQNWNGTITITGSGSGSTSGGPYSDVWKYSIASNATIQLPTVASNIQGWTGTFAGSAAIDASDVLTSCGCC